MRQAAPGGWEEEERRGDQPDERRRRTHRGPRPLTDLPGPAGSAPHLQSATVAAPRPRTGGGRGGREALLQHRACKQIRPHVTM